MPSPPFAVPTPPTGTHKPYHLLFYVPFVPVLTVQTDVVKKGKVCKPFVVVRPFIAGVGVELFVPKERTGNVYLPHRRTAVATLVLLGRTLDTFHLEQRKAEKRTLAVRAYNVAHPSAFFVSASPLFHVYRVLRNPKYLLRPNVVVPLVM